VGLQLKPTTKVEQYTKEDDQNHGNHWPRATDFPKWKNGKNVGEKMQIMDKIQVCLPTCSMFHTFIFRNPDVPIPTVSMFGTFIY